MYFLPIVIIIGWFYVANLESKRKYHSPTQKNLTVRDVPHGEWIIYFCIFTFLFSVFVGVFIIVT